MTLESLLPPPPCVSPPPRPAGLNGVIVRCGPAGHVLSSCWGCPGRLPHAPGAPMGQGGGTNPGGSHSPQQARARRAVAPSPSPPGRAGPAVPSLPGQRRQLLWVMRGVPGRPGLRAAREAPATQRDGASRARSFAATPVWAERTPLPPGTCPAQPAPWRPGRPRTGRCRQGQGPPSPGRAGAGSARRAGGAQGTCRSPSSECPGALGAAGAVSPLVPTGRPRPCCPLLTSPHCVPRPAPHPVLPLGSPGRLQPLCPRRGAPKVRGAAKCLPPAPAGSGGCSISCGQEPPDKDRCAVLQPPADVSGWDLGRAASRGPAPARWPRARWSWRLFREPEF